MLILIFSACPILSYGRRGSVCPLAASVGKTVCIEDRQLCDGAWDCPDREDEHPIMCLFYRAVRILGVYMCVCLSTHVCKCRCRPINVYYFIAICLHVRHRNILSNYPQERNVPFALVLYF